MKTNGKYYSFKKTNGKGYDDALRSCIEETCQYCIDNTFLNTNEKINKPIMMLGKIQSGKTRAFIGLIALAFDNEFDMAFILTKNSKALVQQTVSRMRKEFKPFIEDHEVVVSDIMKANTKISGYQLEQKNIIVAKKESQNISKLIDFLKNYSIGNNKKCLIIDDEADTTGIGYNKDKNSDEFTLRTVSSKVNEMRGTLDGCVFVQVTATPYALYLQPDFDESSPLKAIKPLKTILVPHGNNYIGGEYYFVNSKVVNSPAYFLFEPMSNEEGEMVSDQKRKGKKSKIEDRRTFKEEEILIREDKLSTFKKGIINFFIGSIVLKSINQDNELYSYVIHTATQKNSHVNLQNIAETFLKQIKNRTDTTLPIIEKLFNECYEDIKKSVIAYGKLMPKCCFVKNEFYSYIDKGYYSIDVVNADQDVDSLLNEETGELNLSTPCSIFVGGQVLDRGVTIPSMIGFYYGRNPKTMQQDTVLQHSRMFGYREKYLPVTRFYTTERIHSNMVKITEIDIELREDIKNQNQGNGIYFITRKDNDHGVIIPCSPDKIRVSDIILLKKYRRILPVGFSPVNKTIYEKHNKEIEMIIKDLHANNDGVYKMSLTNAEVLLENVYATFIKDDMESNFIEYIELIASLRYLCKDNDTVYCTVNKNMDIKKYKNDGKQLQDSPDTAKSHLEKAKRYAVDSPCIMLFQENGNDESWNFRQFWWPVLVVPKNVQNTVYAAKDSIKKVSNKPKTTNKQKKRVCAAN